MGWLTWEGTGTFLAIYFALGFLTLLVILSIEIGRAYFEYYSKNNNHTISFEHYLSNHLEVDLKTSSAIVTFFPFFIVMGLKELLVHFYGNFGDTILRFIGRMLTKLNKYLHPENHV